MSESQRPPATHEPGTKPLLPPREPRYVYHWGRILGLIVVLALVGGLGTYGYRHWTSTPAGEEASAEIPTEEQPAVTARSELPETIPEPFSRDGEEAPAANTAVTGPSTMTGEPAVKPLREEAMVGEELPLPMAGEQASTLPPEASETTEVASAETEEPAASGEASGKPVYFIDQEIPSETEAAVEAQPKPEPVKPAVVKPQVVTQSTAIEPVAEAAKIEPQAGSGRFVLQNLRINAAEVKRFQLARAVRNREPVGELSDIEFNSKDSTSVLAFSEVGDMRGQRLNYVWLRDGNQIARVRVRVGGDHWRSYSSKNVNRSMTGEWRVELRDGKDRLLASADFRL